MHNASAMKCFNLTPCDTDAQDAFLRLAIQRLAPLRVYPSATVAISIQEDNDETKVSCSFAISFSFDQLENAAGDFSQTTLTRFNNQRQPAIDAATRLAIKYVVSEAMASLGIHERYQHAEAQIIAHLGTTKLCAIIVNRRPYGPGNTSTTRPEIPCSNRLEQITTMCNGKPLRIIIVPPGPVGGSASSP